MAITRISTKEAPAALGPYAQGVRAGGLVFCSGQLGLDPASGALEAGVEAQARRAMENLKAVLAAEGLGFANVAKTTIFLKDMADFAKVNEVYGSYFEGAYPARSTIQVAALPKGGLVEIEAMAVA